MVVYNNLAWIQENKCSYYTKPHSHATIFIVHTHSLNTHPLTNKANSIWGGNVLAFGLLEFTLQLVSLSEVNGSYAKNLAP